MQTMTKKEANEKLTKMVREAVESMNATKTQAIALADEYGLHFAWDSTYGSREQDYYSKEAWLAEQGFETEEAWLEHRASKRFGYYGYNPEPWGWTSSSEGC